MAVHHFSLDLNDWFVFNIQSSLCRVENFHNSSIGIELLKFFAVTKVRPIGYKGSFKSLIHSAGQEVFCLVAPEGFDVVLEFYNSGSQVSHFGYLESSPEVLASDTLIHERRIKTRRPINRLSQGS